MRHLAVVAVVVLAGCATTHPSPKRETIQFIKGRDAVKDCTSLGIVDSRDEPKEGMPVPTGIEDHRFRQLRRSAEKLGADTVLLLDEPTAGMSGEDVLRGEAYKCAPRE